MTVKGRLTDRSSGLAIGQGPLPAQRLSDDLLQAVVLRNPAEPLADAVDLRHESSGIARPPIIAPAGQSSMAQPP